MPFLVHAILVSVVAFMVDVAYTFYIRRAAQGKAIPAALWSGAIALAGSFNVLAYISDRRLIVPMVAGYIAGTYWAVTRDQK
jgi:hypothetical protein